MTNKTNRANKTNETYGTNRTNRTNRTNKTNGAHKTHRTHRTHKTYGSCALLALLLLAGVLHAQAQAQSSPQVHIGGNVYGGGEQGVVNGNGNVTIKNGTLTGDVYGGGNLGDLTGQTTVTLRGGDMQGAVFGGARMADVGKSTLVNIDGEHQLHDIMCSWVFGGNDISGSIGSDMDGTESPRIATADIDNTFHTHVYTTKERISEDPSAPYHIYVGQMFGGGNGDYTFESVSDSEDPDYGKYRIIRGHDKTVVGTIPASMLPAGATSLPKPEVARSYVNVGGGIYGYVFNGGNNATITDKAVISINNTSAITSKCTLPTGMAFDLDDYTRRESLNMNSVNNPIDLRLIKMGLNLSTFETGNHFLRVFGGNNQAEMSIIPTWDLRAGKIRDLYSGGNKGDMTNYAGILLEIPKTSAIEVTNAYGGCRMANVRPMRNGVEELTVSSYDLNMALGLPENTYRFPDNLSARILVRGGRIHNVYGGNDITGNVFGGTAVGVYTSISGDVYGGGNGSYAYTDNAELKDDIIWGDFYYDPTQDGAASSVDALNAFRPNVEQVSLRIVGDSESEKTIIGGAIYVGGNSATLLEKTAGRDRVELKIGSHAYADNVFLGNNGELMVDASVGGTLATYAGAVISSDQSVHDFSTLDLTDAETFAKYMNGAAMRKMPRVVFDGEGNDPGVYEDYSSFFGSFFCGGNRGSMIQPGLTTIDFNHKVIIYDKLVGGCNNADIPVQTGTVTTMTGEHSTGTATMQLNASYRGGFIGSPEEQQQPLYTDTDGETIKDRLVLNLNGLEIRPLRWKEGNEKELEWNTISAADGSIVAPGTGGEGSAATAADLDRRLKGGNIYGGCYTSGHIHGNVIINLNGAIIKKDDVFDIVETATDVLYDSEPHTIVKRNSGVLLDEQGMDALGQSLNVFGGGCGEGTEIWGSTTVNLLKGYTFQIFGGSEHGVIGKRSGVDSQLNYAAGTLDYDPRFSTTVNLNGRYPGVPIGEETAVGLESAEDVRQNMSEAEFIYGGGFEGDVAGNCTINLDNGRLFNSFAGACNATILGHTETYIGVSGFPYIRDHIYGGNDLGGRILGEGDMSSHVTATTLPLVYKYDESSGTADVLKASAYVEYRKGHVVNIFGGCYGDYDYGNPRYDKYTYTLGGVGTVINDDPVDEDAVGNLGMARDGFSKPRMGNAFVNFRPVSSNSPYNTVSRIFGAGQGHTQDSDRDIMQERSYVLINIPESSDNFASLEVFGSGSFSGLGMEKSFDVTHATPDRYTAVIDLISGTIQNVFGASYNEGITRRTMVNVPSGSKIRVGNIFGGGYGNNTFLACDAYDSNVNYASNDATVTGAIFGGNNQERRTIYAHVNIRSTVWSDKDKGYQASIYGAGRGANTWAEYTEVNLLSGARIYEVYGGGQQGKVLNARSNQHYINHYKPTTWPAGTPKAGQQFTNRDWVIAWKVGNGYDPDHTVVGYDEFGGTNGGTRYFQNLHTNLGNPWIVRPAEYDERQESRVPTEQLFKYNTNVIIHEGATVGNYAYGGGYGEAAVVAGTTYVALLGGTVVKDIYGSGTSGDVKDLQGNGYYDSVNNLKGYTASTNVYIKGGWVRNVYGGGWRGDVGRHDAPAGLSADAKSYMAISNSASTPYTVGSDDIVSGDIDGHAHVAIGDEDTAEDFGKWIDSDGDGVGYLSGIPCVIRSVYGGGEGGSVFGETHVTIHNGYIGYRFDGSQSGDYAPNASTGLDSRYVEEIHDWGNSDPLKRENGLQASGNIFGGGYVANSYVDHSIVDMYGGIVRGSLFGGGEIGPIGRGSAAAEAPVDETAGDWHNNIAKIYKSGSTHVYLYSGHVMRDIFGGGRGYDSWGGDGYMTEAEQPLMDLSSKGYVFGRTEVRIRGGEVGRSDNVMKADGSFGYGNVFGGGDVGYVFSGSGKKKGSDPLTVNSSDGLPTDGGGYYYYKDNIANGMTLDCRVVIEPWCKAKEDIGTVSYPMYVEGTNSIGKIIFTPETLTSTFKKGDYVPIGYLNQLKDKTTPEGAAAWAKLDDHGVIIHNAIFAGGNVTIGSDQIFINTGTVFGNATVNLRDIYNRDLVTIGTERIGGIYGDGNLTFVDGFREIHIDNYGTDFYHLIASDIDKSDYDRLDDREKAYYKVSLMCIKECTDREGHTYHPGDRLTSEEFRQLFVYDATADPGTVQYIDQEGHYNIDYWTENGYNIYQGRILNTLQRADFCGVYGSRLVLFGARDRVPEKADYTEYTINRLGELSLNQRETQAAGEESTNQKHGNYFGIYNIVNYLGALTSDVRFDSERTTKSTKDGTAADGKTFFDWKNDAPKSRKRNNGSSPNEVALASGVHLDLISELTEQHTDTVWGYVTGVVQLDLIDVKVGMGGGYVYAKNEHGLKKWHGQGNTDGQPVWDKVTLSPYNLTARTYRRYEYDETQKNYIETSGNFVHSDKEIVDDCFPVHEAYEDTGDKKASPAHYWYIKGYIYVYDQYISAYTGSANAYAQTTSIPLTLSASAFGKITLREVQPNRYAYYDRNNQPIGTNMSHITANNIEYELGQPIDYWQWSLLSESDQRLFVPMVYNVVEEFKLGDHIYQKGDVMLPGAYKALSGTPYIRSYDETGAETWVDATSVDATKTIDFYVRPANNVSHDTGYALTFDMTNPNTWDKYYTNLSDRTTSKRLRDYNKLDDSKRGNYIEGPTYSPYATGVYGQRAYSKSEIVFGNVVTAYNSIPSETRSGLTDQAEIAQAWVATEPVVGQYLENGVLKEETINTGTAVYAARYENWSDISSKMSPAKVCTSTLKLADDDYVYVGTLFSGSDETALKSKLMTLYSWTETEAGNYLDNYLDDAWYCTNGGLYGGQVFEKGKPYHLIETWSSMSEADRAAFYYNYDGLDLLIDPTFTDLSSYGYGYKPQYDGYKPWYGEDTYDEQPYYGLDYFKNDVDKAAFFRAGINDPQIYSESQPIDYEAEFKPDATLISALTASGHYNAAEGGYLTYTYKDETETTRTKVIHTGYDNRIDREDFEKIPNERVHWSPITVTNPGNYYVVKEPFIRGGIPYTVGEVIDLEVYQNLGSYQANIETINFPDTKDEHGNYLYVQKTIDEHNIEHWQPMHYYYCRESYVVGEHGEGVGFENLVLTETKQQYDVGSTVPQYILINQANFDKLVNLQAGFVIHGTTPVETSTLYVSRESNIYDLQKEKIITAVFLYEYHESDESGHNLVPMSERHIVNIHLKFESGVPEIGPLEKPATVIPGNSVGMKIPSVKPGAFEITSAGWEMFANAGDAALHRNGIPYYNNATDLYWYQNDYYVAYYAQTYLGRTYSNAVQFTVANYHDLGKVMDDKEHHYYIDHKDVDREPKIYLNDYSSRDDGKDGAQLLKELVDLSYYPKTYDDETEEPIAISDGSDLDGHIPLERTAAGETVKPMRGGKYLEFIIKADQHHTGTWTPIGSAAGSCFQGTLHGDGHTISGLDHSLFGHLCGDVYNLGVTGTFTSAGIADEGEGYVENSWVMSSATTGFADDVRAVLGNPMRDPSGSKPKQIVNCYYPQTNPYKVTTEDVHGLAMAKPLNEFYNGEVSYDLNGFYLHKRFNDHVTGQSQPNTYKYWDADHANADGTLPLKDGRYMTETDYALFYVEDRYSDGDFIYAGGTVPESDDQRLYHDPSDGSMYYYAIWPDDYLYFGQTLTYGWDDSRAHQDTPSAINKTATRLLSDRNNNRVYRAPAYFSNKKMDVAHFNPYAIFASQSKDGTREAFVGLTAIDFTGYNDVANGYQRKRVTTNGYKDVASGEGAWYPPLLDDDGLLDFINYNVTNNLLVFIPQPTATATDAATATYTAVTNRLQEPEYGESSEGYRRVYWFTNINEVSGHRVVRNASGTGYTAPTDHFLVDKHDFNCPIEYTMAGGKRMWYQRRPASYVDMKKGWESVSLPFTAEIVSTQDKGELTHYYSGSRSSHNDTGTKYGHEYWLRQIADDSSLTQAEDDEGNTIAGVYEATFTYPIAPASADAEAVGDKQYTNKFLWDYYYSYSERRDDNTDQYRQYYNSNHTYEDYVYSHAARPYIIGFPGKTYYEFDLSGEWKPYNTYEDIDLIEKQTVTFASHPGTTIRVSDDETASYTAGTKHGYSYAFRPNYLSHSLNPAAAQPSGFESAAYYQLNAAGDRYEKVVSTKEDPEDPSSADVWAKAVPFRPYFVATAVSPSRQKDRLPAQAITFGSTTDIGDMDMTAHYNGSDDGGLLIYAKKGKIVVESQRKTEATVRILTTSGLTVNTFAIQPGETVETPIHATGIYIANGKKLRVEGR